MFSWRRSFKIIPFIILFVFHLNLYADQLTNLEYQNAANYIIKNVGINKLKSYESSSFVVDGKTYHCWRVGEDGIQFDANGPVYHFAENDSAELKLAKLVNEILHSDQYTGHPLKGYLQLHLNDQVYHINRVSSDSSEGFYFKNQFNNQIFNQNFVDQVFKKYQITNPYLEETTHSN